MSSIFWEFLQFFIANLLFQYHICIYIYICSLQLVKSLLQTHCRPAFVGHPKIEILQPCTSSPLRCGGNLWRCFASREVRSQGALGKAPEAFNSSRWFGYVRVCNLDGKCQILTRCSHIQSLRFVFVSHLSRNRTYFIIFLCFFCVYLSVSLFDGVPSTMNLHK